MSNREFYGDDVEHSDDYARIVNERSFNRLATYLDQGEVVFGGEHNPDGLILSPTIITNPQPDAPLMEEEIFGPVLPIVTYDHLDWVIADINRRSKPLSLYLFSRDRAKREAVLQRTSSGGVTINDTTVHGATTTLFFGGVGNSGFGAYRGKATFDTFTHYKSVMTRGFRPDLSIRNTRYRALGRLKTLLRVLGWAARDRGCAVAPGRRRAGRQSDSEQA